MSTQPHDADPAATRDEPPAAGTGTDEGVDFEEDRRRQRELDDGELGGEA
jgi:hypothetical protein